MERAVFCRAAGIVVAHNHPSGVCFPSWEDRNFTGMLSDALRPLGISLFDHLIVTRSQAVSLLTGARHRFSDAEGEPAAEEFADPPCPDPAGGTPGEE